MSDKDRDRIDKLFELGLLLVTVLAASELGYAAVRYAADLSNVNFVFRVLTIPIVILIMVWLVNDLLPSLPFDIPLRRLVREFCWVFLGNLFVFEILLFIGLSFTAAPFPLGLWVQAGTSLAFLITFPATLRYREVEGKSASKRLRYRAADALVEHIAIFIAAYLLMLGIALASGYIPMP